MGLRFKKPVGSIIYYFLEKRAVEKPACNKNAQQGSNKPYQGDGEHKACPKCGGTKARACCN